MKAIVIREFADPQPFPLVEIDEPEPGPGEVKVAVACVGVTFGEMLIATGKYQVLPDPPFSPGGECAGIVEAVGPGVTDFRPGDRVTALGFVGKSGRTGRTIGACREKMVVPAANLSPVPDGVDMETAALFRSNAETALLALQDGRLRAGESLLVLGAGGGTGTAAVALGKYLGARVIASASSAEKRAIALGAGADIAIDSRAEDWREQVEAAAGGKVDVIFDPVGDSQAERAFRTLAYGGRHLVIGFAAGAIPRLPLNLPLLKSASVIGVNLLNVQEVDPARCAANTAWLLDLLKAGKLPAPVVTRRYPLAEAEAAYREVAAGETAGRIVIEVG